MLILLKEAKEAKEISLEIFAQKQHPVMMVENHQPNSGITSIKLGDISEIWESRKNTNIPKGQS